MELRVPGIGGPSPESVLGCDPGAAVPTWRSEPAARSMVRHAAGGDGSVHVYDWRPLTSGSRSFVVWPLLAPFTLVNISGWMGPPDRRPAWLHRWTAVVLGATVTVQCVVWFVVAATDCWTVFLGDGRQRLAFWAGAATAAIAVGLLVTGATYTAAGFERFRPPAWRALDPPHASLRRPWGEGMSQTIADERFFDSGSEHRWHWRVHVVLAAVTIVATVAVAVADGGASRPWPGLSHALLAAGIAPMVAIGLLVLVGVLPDESGRGIAARLSAAGVAALGVLLLGGLVSAAMIAIVGIDHLPPGPAMMLFDVYGWMAAGVGALALVISVFAVQTPSPVERAPTARALLGSIVARLRARLAPALPHGDIVLGLLGVAVPVTAAAVMWVRWFGNDDGEAWRLTPTLGTQIGRWTVFAVAGLMIVNLVKSKADPAALRRIGNLWDVITFWPRSFHPFAVRPYAERAVPELREYIVNGRRPTPLVVTAHSQGTVLVVAATLPIAEQVTPPLGLVTFGSPLRDLYARFFPRSFAAAALEPLRDAYGPRWRNLFRYTDHVGRAVFVDDGAALVTYLATSPGLLSDLADRPISDPSPTDRMLEGHNRYWAAAEVCAAVKELSRD